MRFGSLFSGIGGFDLGFEQAGLSCSWQVETDGDCNRVLEKHWSGVEKHKDVRDVGKLESVDVICGGFPCQDLSVAGQRKGLAGERSGLWFEFLRIVGLNKPRWVVVENVPGLLSGCGCAFCRQVGRNLRVHSIWRNRYFDRTGQQYRAPCAACDAGRRLLESHSGRNFQIVLSGLVELGYCIASRILDAQFYGVAQRRRRVFIVGSLGDGSCAEILFESESVSWNPPTRREAGAGTPAVSVRRAQAGSNGWGVKTDGSTETLDGTGGDAVIAANNFGERDISTALSSKNERIDGDTETFVVTHALRSEGADASQDGTGRGTPPVVANCFNGYTGGPDDNDAQANHIIAFAQNTRDEVRIQGDGQISGALANQPGMKQQTYIAFSSKDHGADAGEIAPTLRSQNFDKSHINGGGQVAIAFQSNAGREMTTLEDCSPSVKVGSGIGIPSPPAVSSCFGVRRLTPRECERLQGFPDDFTRYDASGKEISDSARYRMLGNAVAVPVARWIGERLARQMHTKTDEVPNLFEEKRGLNRLSICSDTLPEF